MPGSLDAIVLSAINKSLVLSISEAAAGHLKLASGSLKVPVGVDSVACVGWSGISLGAFPY